MNSYMSTRGISFITLIKRVLSKSFPHTDYSDKPKAPALNKMKRNKIKIKTTNSDTLTSKLMLTVNWLH